MRCRWQIKHLHGRLTGSSKIMWQSWHVHSFFKFIVCFIYLNKILISATICVTCTVLPLCTKTKREKSCSKTSTRILSAITKYPKMVSPKSKIVISLFCVSTENRSSEVRTISVNRHLPLQYLLELHVLYLWYPLTTFSALSFAKDQGQSRPSQCCPCRRRTDQGGRQEKMWRPLGLLSDKTRTLE